MKDLTQGNIYKNFVLFAIPLILAGLLSSGYNTIDTIIAGKFIGESGLAATGSTSSLLGFLSWVFWGWGMGLSIYIGRLFGAKDYQTLKTTIYNNLIVLIAVTLFISMLIIIFRNFIMDIFQVDSAIRKEALRYMVCYIAGLFTIVLSSSFVHIMNALGISGFPFYMSLISAVLNIAGNIFTIVVLKMGVTGVALSTVFSALAVDIFYLLKLRSCFNEMGVEKHRVTYCPACVKSALAFAAPVTLQQALMSCAGLLVSPMINALGSVATAAHTVSIRLYDINSQIYQHSAKALGNYTSQSIGAGKIKNLQKGVYAGLLQGIVFVLPTLLACIIFAKPICKMFFPSDYSGEALTYCIHYLRFFLPFILFNLVNNLTHTFFRAAGSMKFLLSLSSLGALVRLIAIYLLIPVLGMYGVFAGNVISWITEAVVSVIVYFSGNWKTPLLRELEQAENKKQAAPAAMSNCQ